MRVVIPQTRVSFLLDENERIRFKVSPEETGLIVEILVDYHNEGDHGRVKYAWEVRALVHTPKGVDYRPLQPGDLPRLTRDFINGFVHRAAPNDIYDGGFDATIDEFIDCPCCTRCTQCNGLGAVDGESCSACDGYGQVPGCPEEPHGQKKRGCPTCNGTGDDPDPDVIAAARPMTTTA